MQKENRHTAKQAHHTKSSKLLDGFELGDFAESVIQSLGVGIVAFDRSLQVIEANSRAVEFISPGSHIDKSLAKGTDQKVGGDWSKVLNEVVEMRMTRNFENVNFSIDGKQRLLHILCTPLIDSRNNMVFGGTVVIEDNTEKVNIQTQLTHSQRLASVGKLASKVAHELNNPLDGVLRYINLAVRLVEEAEMDKCSDYLQYSRQGIMRMVYIVSELLEFSRNTGPTFGHSRIDSIIEEAIHAMEPKIIATGVKVVRDYAEEMPEVISGNLFQVFCNLIKNAVEAMTDGGTLTISCCPDRDDTVVMVQFSDTGPGFDPADSEAIFEPFFTTKRTSKGTGLGLAICKDIIEKYNGKILAESAPDKGCVFTVFLPSKPHK